MKDKIFTILREYSEENGIMASEIFLKEYSEELVRCGCVIKGKDGAGE